MLHSTLSAVKSALSGNTRNYTSLHELHMQGPQSGEKCNLDFADTSTSLHVLHGTFSAVKTASSGHSSTYTGLHELHRTFTVVKTAFSISPGIKQACTCFTAPHRRLKRLYQVFHAHTQACTSFTGPPRW